MTQADSTEMSRAVDILSSAGGMVHASTLRRAGVHNVTLTRLLASGKIERPSRGVYRLVEASSPPSQWESFAAAALRFPSAVVFHLSAAVYHGLTMENPTVVWLLVPATEVHGRVAGYVFVRSRREALFVDGVEAHRIDGVPVRITSPARTVVDLFRHALDRPAIGTIDDGVKALAKFVEDGGTAAEISGLAHRMRVDHLTRPYLHAAQHMTLSS